MNRGRGRGLRDVSESEDPLATGGSGQGGNGNVYSLHGRVSAIEADIKHLATKNDITSLKVWMLVGVLGGIVSGIGIVVSVAILITRIAAVVPNG